MSDVVLSIAKKAKVNLTSKHANAVQGATFQIQIPSHPLTSLSTLPM